MSIYRSIISTPTALFIGLLVCMSWTVGCGPAEPPRGSVSGKVTYNGQPLASGAVAVIVTLIDEGAGEGASARIDSSGNYHIPTILAGEYAVAVYNEPPQPGGKVVKLDIPDKYQDVLSSGLKVTVKEGKNTADLKL